MYKVVERHVPTDILIFVTPSWEEVADYFDTPVCWSRKELNDYLNFIDSPFRVEIE